MTRPAPAWPHSAVPRSLQLVEMGGELRLASPNLETWAARDRPALQDTVQWPVRVEQHCRYIADKVPAYSIPSSQYFIFGPLQFILYHSYKINLLYSVFLLSCNLLSTITVAFRVAFLVGINEGSSNNQSDSETSPVIFRQ